MPADWRWLQDFIHDLIRWARALAWMPEPAEVSWAELALDYEAFVGRALWGMLLPYGVHSEKTRGCDVKLTILAHFQGVLAP